MASHTIVLSMDKETKNTIRYAEEADEPLVRTIYVRKSALPQPWPVTIEVTINISEALDA